MVISILSGSLYDADFMRFSIFFGSSLTIVGMCMTSLARTYADALLAQGVTVGLVCGLLFLPAVVIWHALFEGRLSCGTGVVRLR